MVEDEGYGTGGLREGGHDVVAEGGSGLGGEDDPGAALELGLIVDAVEEAQELAAAAEDEDVVGEVVAGAALTEVVAAVEEDDGDGGGEEGGDEQGSYEDDEELEEEREGRTERELGAGEEETYRLGPAGLSARGGQGEGCGGPEEADEPEKEQEKETQPQRPEECAPGMAGEEGAVEMPQEALKAVLELHG